MYCLELIKFDVSNSSYYVQVENGALLHDIARSWKMILGGHGKVFKNFKEKCRNPVSHMVISGCATSIACCVTCVSLK